MNGHSKLAPSSASRWTACTASVKFIEDNAHLIPSDTSSVFADEGTRAHKAASDILQNIPPVFDDSEMQAHVENYVAFVRKDIRPGDTHWVERAVPLFYYEQDRGTVDDTIFAPDRIVVKDLKYGAGVGVYADRNKQLAIYAESVIRMIEVIDEVKSETSVILQIYQPRDRNDPEPVREWAITRGELAMFCWDIEQAQQAIAEGRIEFKPEPKTICRWCPAKGFCRAYANYGLVALPVLESPLDVTPALPNPDALTREQRNRVLQSKNDLESWLKAVEDQERKELENGAEPMAFKLVAGKSNRQWTDEIAVDKLLSNYLDAQTRYVPDKLISPSAAEKALKGIKTSTKFENRFAELIHKPEGSPTLVPITDSRPALGNNKTIPFSNLDDGAELV